MDPRIVHEFMSNFVPMAIIVTGTVATAWVSGVIVSAFKQRARLRAQTEFHNRMLDKFSSADEFTAYLKSDAGRSFFENIGGETAGTPIGKILSSIQRGAIFTLLGLGLIILGNIFSTPEGGGVMLVFGVVSFMIGAGFLVSSYISYRLAKTWGMISPAAKQSETVATV
jgi:hypothetical protein